MLFDNTQLVGLIYYLLYNEQFFEGKNNCYYIRVALHYANNCVGLHNKNFKFKILTYKFIIKYTGDLEKNIV